MRNEEYITHTEEYRGYYGRDGITEAIRTAKDSIDYLCKSAQEMYEKEPKKLAAEHYMV